MPLIDNHVSKQPTVPLYHYTSQNGFLGIVDTKSLWATNLYYMNDATEMKHAVAVASRAIDALTANAQDGPSPPLGQWFKQNLANLEEFPIFSCSFSEERDLLSQWRGYTGDCGFSLCFDPLKLQEIAAFNEFRMVKCIYDEADQFAIADESVRKCFQLYETLYGKTSPSEAAEGAIRQLITDFYVWGPLLKHPSFKEENEWRLLSDVHSYKNSNIRFRAGKHSIIPYRVLKLDIDFSEKPSCGRSQLGFYDILIGPTPVKELPWKAVMQLCEAKNIYFTQITPTGIPYRSV